MSNHEDFRTVPLPPGIKEEIAEALRDNFRAEWLSIPREPPWRPHRPPLWLFLAGLAWGLTLGFGLSYLVCRLLGGGRP